MALQIIVTSYFPNSVLFFFRYGYSGLKYKTRKASTLRMSSAVVAGIREKQMTQNCVQPVLTIHCFTLPFQGLCQPGYGD